VSESGKEDTCLPIASSLSEVKDDVVATVNDIAEAGAELNGITHAETTMKEPEPMVGKEKDIEGDGRNC
jgi:hypothetical protein